LIFIKFRKGSKSLLTTQTSLKEASVKFDKHFMAHPKIRGAKHKILSNTETRKHSVFILSGQSSRRKV